MIPSWVAVVTGISLAILALAAIAIALSSVIAVLALRTFLRILEHLAGPAVSDVRQLVATIRTEAESLVGTSRELRGRIVKAADAAETRLADLLRAFPYDYLYGNIAADTSLAKKNAPVGRHCHAWHVGQEIFDLAPTDPLRAFGLGYLSHLAADAVAHNFFVPRQLVLTSSTAALGHSYWESRFETHLGDAYAREARDVILQDHTQSDTHLDGILSPTLFSQRTNRRLFRDIAHLTESQSWQWVFQVIAGASRWDLADSDIEKHMAVAFEYVMETLGADASAAAARRLDPAGEKALGLAKRMRRQALREGGRHEPERVEETAQQHFGLPTPALEYWKQSRAQRPWRES